MIWESGPWKRELLASARALDGIRKKRRSESRSFQFERSIFLCAYIMRKLSESQKLSSSWDERVIPCIFHPLKGRRPDFLNWHRIEELFDLDVSEARGVSARDLCNRIIHSFVFMEVAASRVGLVGFFFTSDKARRQGLWYVELEVFLKLVRDTGRDYPSSSHMVRDPKTDEWVVWKGHGHPPSEWTRAADLMANESAAKINRQRRLKDGNVQSELS